MSKDSQIDPKEIREAKANGNPSLASEEEKNSNANAKKQSIKRN